LYLVVSKEGHRKWVFISSRNGKRQDMGLGKAGKGGVSLAQARDVAARARELLAAGGDPLAARRKGSREAARVPNFGEIADKLVETMAPEWRNAKHKYQWAMTLRKYAAPLRALPVNSIGTEEVLQVLKPIWTTIPRLPRASAGASSVSWTPPKLLATALEKTPHCGEGTWLTYFPGGKS
jgi:hypothetical protein